MVESGAIELLRSDGERGKCDSLNYPKRSNAADEDKALDANRGANKATVVTKGRNGIEKEWPRRKPPESK